jgi:hypothetical protein
MESAFPQLAFNQWLSRRLQNLTAAMGPESAEESFLGGAVDHADLERRLHALRHGRNYNFNY